MADRLFTAESDALKALGSPLRGRRKRERQTSGEFPWKLFDGRRPKIEREIRIKHKSSAPMHLKSYQIDGRLLRTGAANFSASGLKRQDNDLNIIESVDAAAAFKRNFAAQFVQGETLPAHDAQ